MRRLAGTLERPTGRNLLTDDLLNKDGALRDSADYLVRIQAPDGFCVPIDSKHSEIAAYQVESVLVLLQAHDLLGDAAYLEPAERLMAAIVERQAPDGSLPIKLLPDDYYERAKAEVMEYTLEPLEKDGQTYPGSTFSLEEFASFGLSDGLLAMAAAAYGRVVDDRFAEAGERALDHYGATFDPVRHKENHFVSFYGIAFALHAFARSQHARRDEMTEAITRLFTEGPTWWDYSPSKLAIVGGNLLAVHGDQFADSHVMPGLDKLMHSGLEVMPGGFGMATSDSQWGDYADIRGALPLAIIMQACDSVAGSTYTQTEIHDRMLDWMTANRRDAVAAGRPFYEVSYPDGRRFGSGTPASILLSWWATGRFGP
jgi:hypothetical protein